MKKAFLTKEVREAYQLFYIAIHNSLTPYSASRVEE